MTNVLYAVSAVAGLIAGSVAMWTLLSRGIFNGRVRSGRNVDAELKAKDRTIATYEQTTKALTERVDQLEEQVNRLQESLDTANAGVAALQHRYEALEKFAAPQAFHAIDTKLDALLEKQLTPQERALVEAKLSTTH